MKPKTDHIQPIQIIGTQRSGSNLLRLILDQSPEIAAPHPPHILEVFYPLLSKYSSLKHDANFVRLINDVCRLIETNPVKWDINLSRLEIAQKCSDRSLLEIFRVVYEAAAISRKARYWCCKSMSNLKYFSLIEGTDINPFYIHLIRDGRDVAASFKSIMVGDKHPYHLATAWRDNYLKAVEIGNRVGPKRFLTIKYETLISDPEKVLEQLSKKLSIHLTPEVLNFYRSQESVKTAKAGFMWRNVANPIMKFNYGNYAHDLSELEIEIFERVASDVLSENGYPLHCKPSFSQFSIKELKEFELTNERLKKMVINGAYLQRDKESGSNRQKLMDELNSFCSIVHPIPSKLTD